MKKCKVLFKKGKTALKTQRGAGICALGIVVIVLSVVSCADIADAEQKTFGDNNGIVWKGEAESHEDALTKWGEPQYDWMYFNTTDKSIYRHNGEAWMLVVDGAALYGEGVVWKGDAESHEDALTKWGEPQKGWMYFNTTGKSLYQFDGKSWALVIEGALPADPSIIWKGEAEGHEDALKWGAPQKGWMYFNTTDQSIYQFDGESWERVVIVGDETNIPAVPVSIHISGAYLSAERGFLSVRLYFTDGSIADGYIDNESGLVMLYTDVWNEVEGYEGKTFHTLRLFNRTDPVPASILVSRVFDEADPVLLNIDAEGELQFRAAIEPIGEGLAYIPIDTAGELALIGRDAETLTGNYLLIRNLDLLGPSTSDSLVQFPHNWQPIKGANAQGESAGRFSGIFDGNGKTITNLYVNYPDNNVQAINYYSTGLFGYLDGARIRNLTVSGSVTGYRECGGIVGSVENSVITNCSFSGVVRGFNSVGGIAGYIEGTTITGTSNAGGTVTATDPDYAAGGLVGVTEVSDISDCSNASAVSGTQNAGGIVGYIYSSTTITNCYNTGTVRTNQRYAGGIVGQIAQIEQSERGSAIRACHNTGSISGTWNGNVGGVVGKAQSATIINCYNTGTVSGDNLIGGVAGEASNIIACYNTGIVSGAGNNVGGVAGEASTITACYNTGTVSGANNVGGVAGRGYEANIAACYNTGRVSGNANVDVVIVGGIVGSLDSGTVAACYWQTGTASAGIAVGGTDETTSFANASDFPAVTSAHAAWGTGTGEENRWWKAGTTGGTRLPQLWFQTE